MKIAVIGTGYVGLVLGCTMANLGNDVICVDIDEKKVRQLSKGTPTIYEPGLKEMLERNISEKRISFTVSIKDAVQKSSIIFLALPTPMGASFEADLSFVKAAAADIGKYMDDYKVIVNKSTVPVGTADLVKKIIKENQKKKVAFDVVSNPEFLREGAALKDSETPDRVIIGVESKKAEEIMVKLYSSVTRVGKPVVVTDIRSAEMIKYASNAMLATRISFMNMLARLCEKVGGDVKEVAKGMGLDSRIGPRFLQAGVGYGGSCFPKDVKALIHTLDDNCVDSSILRSVDALNASQRMEFIRKAESMIDLKGCRVAVWGLAFKPKTDDMREAPSLTVIPELQRRGAKIHAFDPVAMDNAKKMFDDVKYFSKPYEAIKDADLLMILTEWNEFRSLDMEAVRTLLKKPNIVDGRNIYEPKEMKALGFNYVGVGRA